MNNGQKSLSINETFILEPVDGVEVYSACTARFDMIAIWKTLLTDAKCINLTSL